jgi:nitroreductase
VGVQQDEIVSCEIILYISYDLGPYMETIKCITTRRSIRKFLDKEVSDAVMRKIIDAARHAPSSRGNFGCSFIIVRDKAVKKELSDLRNGMNESSLMTCSVVMVVCSDTTVTPRWLENGVMCAETILFAVHDLGLGAVYTTGFNPSDEKITRRLQQILGLPEHIMPVCVIPIGFPDPSYELKEKKLKDIDELIHKDRW